MFRLMFKHLSSDKQNKENINDRRVNGTGYLLTQFGDKHTYYGAYQAKKEIH